MSTGLTIGLAAYEILSPDDDVAGKTSSSISLMEAAGLEGGKIYKINNLYSTIDSAMGFFYVSYDTWVEDIVITVFTDTHAHISESFLNENGTLKQKEAEIKMYTENDYTAGDAGRGLKWKEDPGVYVSRVMHMGDNKNDKKAVEGRGGLENEVPFNNQ